MANEILAPTVYFSQTGEENTTRTLDLARIRMEALGIRTVVAATTSGETGVLAARMLKDFEVIIVSHSTGFSDPNLQEISVENRQAIEAAGATILTCQHALGGVNRAIRRTYQTYQTDEIIANTLRLFGQGIKVCIEMSLMASDAGLVRTDQPVMFIAGSGSGADTAVVLKPANAHKFFEVNVLEIVCRPSPHHPAFENA